MGKGLSFGRLLVDFSLWCTIVCLNKIVTSAKWMAIVFTIIFLAMCFLFVFISVNCTLKFFKFPSSTELSIDIQTTPFPRFSFCNENPMKRSVVDSNGAYTEIATLLRQYELIEQNKTSADDYGLTSTTSRLQRQHRARLMLRLLMAKLSKSDRLAAGYSFTELVTECTIAGVTCTSADFTPFLHPEYGVCFTFNGERTISKAGQTEGLRMLMTVNQDSPLAGTFDFLPTTDSTTIWAVIYDDADYPDFMKDGIRVGASTQSFVALSKSTHSRMEKPYGNCTEDGSTIADYYGNHTYTLQLCQHACLQRSGWERCGCVDPLYPKMDNQTVCTTAADMLCLINLANSVSSANSLNGTTMCGCRPPCIDSVYDKTITNSIFPSEKYKVATGTQAQRGVLLGEQGGGRQGGGSDDSDHYENPVTVTVRATQGTTKTTGASGIGMITSSTTSIYGIPTTTTNQGSYSSASSQMASSDSPSTSTTIGRTTTTSKPESCMYKGPPNSARAALSGIDWCRSNNPSIFNDPNLIAIQGYPCTSTKTCNTCVFFSNPPSIDAFPCSYISYPLLACNEKNNAGYLPLTSPLSSCASFFNQFDFIPLGTNVPNLTQWWTGTLPGVTGPCFSQMGTAQKNCWLNSDCASVPSSSDLSSLKSVPLESSFLSKLSSTTTPCQMADIALQEANKHYSTSGKRKKRDTTSSNSTVDVPGFGSCEYANKNFNGAQSCIEWYKRNGLMIHVYFETLEVKSYTQGATYPLVALISDISGHAGLWLGMSVVSLVELIALLVMCINTLLCGRKINLADEYEIKKELDNRERSRARME